MKSERKLLSEVKFASFLTYSPYGESEVSVKSRKVRDAIKLAARGKIETIVKRLGQEELGRCSEWFGADVTLIPVPRSSPFPRGRFVSPESALWVSKQICFALVEIGMAAEIVPCLERVTAVKKSAFSARGERPTVEEHYDSLACNPTLISGQKILLVDDVITKGRTMLACASRVAETYFEKEVKAFSLLRTMGLVREIEHIIDPCRGTVSFRKGEANRQP